MNMSRTAWMVLTDLWADRGRTALSILTLVLMTVGYLILAGFSESVRLFGSQADDRRDLVVVEKGVLDPMSSRVEEQTVATIRAIAGEEARNISVCQFRHMQIEQQIVQLRGCPVQDWQNVHHLRLAAGAWPDGQEVAITRGAATVTGWKIGDQLQIYGSNFSISGLVDASGTKFSAVWMPLEISEQLFEKPGIYQVVMIQAAAGIDSEDLRARIESSPLLAGRYDVMFLDSLFSRYTEVVRGLLGVSQWLALAAVSLVILGSYQATRLSLEERSRTIALMRVAGFSEGQLLQILQLRSAWILTISFVIGTILASVLLAWANSVSPLQMQSVQLEVALTAPALLIGYPLTLICGALGTWFSSQKLLHQTIAALMRI